MHRGGLLLAAAGMMIGASAIHAQYVDPDIAACNNTRRGLSRRQTLILRA
jgi:hypothetical protein